MSLRVLLADESASIRKVFQMGLQDYGAEVKSVHNGLDVIEVSENYQPHIIFADILLQKKTGYEVCEELKSHATLGSVPVVLMWSSFMELDQKRYANCGAQGELEKPFDVESMRGLITQLVEETKDQQISQFLEFPESIQQEFVEDEKSKSGMTNPASVESPLSLTLEQPDSPVPENTLGELPYNPDSDVDPYPTAESTSVFNLHEADSQFDMQELETFAGQPKTEEEIVEISEEETWQAQALQDVKPEPQVEKKSDNFESMDLHNNKNLNLDDFLYKPESGLATPPAPEGTTSQKIADLSTSTPFTGTHKLENKAVTSNNTSQAKISPDEAEAIIRQETRMLLQKTIKEQLPKVLEQVVREELKKVLEQEMAIKASDKNL